MTQPSLLSTKFYAPKTGEGLVSRPRLLQILSLGLQTKRKLTLVSAPAGYGKSTIIAEWLEQARQTQAAECFAWLSLDEKDNDPARFLTYGIAALQKVRPDMGQYTLTLLDSFPQPDPEMLLITLINEISALACSFVLVLDDYHQIEAGAVHSLMRFLMDHQPENLHLVLITRQDPPFPIARFRASSQVTEIRASQLRFTPEEVKQFFQGHGLQLQADWMQTLENRTEGWAVGLSLAALSMHGHDNLETFFQSFSGTHRYILDYLFDEVMRQQPDLFQEFLSQTAILERFCAPLCDAVLNQSNSQSYLAQIERANLFLIPLDDQRIWYRYHHLFADSLRAGLEQSQPGQVSELHRRAALWFENNNLPDEAIQHALAAPDLETAARLIEKYTQLIIFERNEPGTFNTWFASLPPEVVHQHPALLPAKAWSEIVLSDLKSGKTWFNQAIDVISSSGLTDENTRSILGQAYTAGATLGMLTGDKTMLSRCVRQALELLPPKALFMRCIAQWCLGQDYRYQQQIVQAEQAFAEAARLSQAAASHFFYLLSLSNQGDRLFELGKLHDAARIYQEIGQASVAGARTLHPIAGEAFLHHSELLLEWNQLEASNHLVMEGFTLARQTGIKEIILNGYEFLARIQMAQRNVTQALQTIQQGIEYAEQYQVHLHVAQMKAWRAHLGLMATHWDKSSCDVPPPSLWADEVRAHLDQPLDALQLITYITLANIDIAEQRYPECARILDQLQQIAESTALGYLWIKIQVVRACCYECRGERKKALESLNQALAKAKPEGCIRVFLDGGPILEKLLKRFSSEPAAVPFQEYLQTLLSDFMDEGYEPVQAVEQTEPFNPPANRRLVEALNERELEILRLIAQGLTNHEIANSLSLSPKTIKWHAYNLYAKLGVNNRTQAVACAREKSLI